MSAELQARRTAAVAVLGDYRREARAWFAAPGAAEPDWQQWALRLGQHLQYLIEATGPGILRSGQ